MPYCNVARKTGRPFCYMMICSCLKLVCFVKFVGYFWNKKKYFYNNLFPSLDIIYDFLKNYFPPIFFDVWRWIVYVYFLSPANEWLVSTASFINHPITKMKKINHISCPTFIRTTQKCKMYHMAYNLYLS